MKRPPELVAALSVLTGQPLSGAAFTPVGGGSINQVFAVLLPSKDRLLLKQNTAAGLPQLFEREADGLARLGAHTRVPRVLGHGVAKNHQWLAMEFIDQSTPGRRFWIRLGEALARLHAQKGASFGHTQNNYMGAVPQQNTPATDWCGFFATNRLMPLARYCSEKERLTPKELNQLERLYRRLPNLFSPAAPSLLHGDFWSGNVLCAYNNEPVLIDPAVYYGHPSVDLGMSRLFGGFPPAFYEAYHYQLPLLRGHDEEWDLCNLYPLLVHLLLFGPAYLPAVKEPCNVLQALSNKVFKLQHPSGM